jgi:hypothetical protein
MAAALDQDAVRRCCRTIIFRPTGTLIEAWASMKSFRPSRNLSAGRP